MQATAHTTGLSTSFQLAQPATVKADGQVHKVTLTILSLGCEVRRYCVPALQTDVYLQARTTNSDAAPLLPSEKCNVFLDGSLITSTRMHLVLPGEAFTTFLGIDAAVKVSHRELDEVQSQQATLFAGRSRIGTVVHHTIVKNTHAETIGLVLVEALPKSTDAQIKVSPCMAMRSCGQRAPALLPLPLRASPPPQVRLVEPAASAISETTASTQTQAADQELGAGYADLDPNASQHILLNSFTNNLIRTLCLSGNSQSNLRFEYTIEYPDRQSVEVVQKP